MISTLTNRSIKRAPATLAVLVASLLPILGAGCGGSSSHQTGAAGTNGHAGQGAAGQGAAGQGAAGQGAAGQGAAGQGGGAGTVVNPTITSITVTPAGQSITKSASQQFTAQASFSDGSTKDVSATATWVSSMTGVATITATGLATGVNAGTTAISATSGGVTGSTTLTVKAVEAVLQSIAVTPADPKIASGTTQALVATGTYDDGSKKDVTAMATWTSATPAVATVAATGVATGVTGGTSVISAKVGTVTGTTTLTVTVAVLQSIAVTPDASTIATGTTLQYKATGTFKEPTTNAVTTQDLTATATWTSGTVATATISAAGLASAKAVGTTTITAKSGTVMGSTMLTVTMAPLQTIEVTTTTPSIAKGTTAKFVATGTFMDGTKQDLTAQVTWTSATPGTATIANTGIATSVAKGTTVISAKLGTVTGMLTLTVTDEKLVSIAVSAELPVASATPKIAKNTKVQLKAIGTYTDSSTHDLTGDVTWASTAGVTVSNADATAGIATAGNAAATSMITATMGTGAAAIVGKLTLIVTIETLSSIQIDPATHQIAKGTTLQYKAIGFFTDASQQDITETVTWASSNAFATISNANGSRGLAKGAGVGVAMITATLGAITDTASLTVSTAVLESISISPPAPTLPLGTTVTLTATGIYTDTTKQDLTDQVTWTTSAGGIATVSNAADSNGKVTPVAKGTADITATFNVTTNQKVTSKITVTVVDIALKSIAVTAATPMTIEKGTTLQFSATGTFTDGSTQDLTKAVTWKSEPTTVATISNATGTLGLATATGTGMATISATSSVATGSIVGSAVLTVNDGKLVSIAVTPATPKIARGTSLQFVATGTYNDGARQDITSSVTWSSDTPANATVDVAGLATGKAAGTAKIIATSGSGATAVAGNTTLTVTAAKLKSIVVDPHPSLSLAKGTTAQFKATGFFDDLSQQDLTDTATWISSATGVATISNAAASNGLLQSVAVGMTNVSAAVTIDAVTVTSAPLIPVTVTTQTLVSIAITTNPPSATASVPKGATLDLVATGTYTDGSTQVLTGGAVTWTTAAMGTATVSNQAGQRGRVTGVAMGMVDISATSTAAMGSKVGKITVTVTAPVVTSIAVTPVNPAALAKTMTRQFSAQATLTDGTKQDVSATATWTSSDTTVATISTAGLLTGVAAGTTNVSAKVGTVPSNVVAQTITN